MLTSWLGGLTLWVSRAPGQADSMLPLMGPTAQSLESQQIGGQQLGVQIRQESGPVDEGRRNRSRNHSGSHGARGSLGQARRTWQRAKAPAWNLFLAASASPCLSRGDVSEEAAGEGLPTEHSAVPRCTHSELSPTLR